MMSASTIIIRRCYKGMPYHFVLICWLIIIIINGNNMKYYSNAISVKGGGNGGRRTSSRTTHTNNKLFASIQYPNIIVPRISVKEFVNDNDDDDDDRKIGDYYNHCKDPVTGALNRPVLLHNALSQEGCDMFCDHLLSRSKQIDVDLQQQESSSSSADTKRKRSVDTQIYQCRLDQAIDIIMRKSNSKRAYLTFCEGLLEEEDQDSTKEVTNDDAMKIRNMVTEARENVFSNSVGNDDNNDHNHRDPDWFSFFPKDAQPTDAVILTGSGATSTLHRDPFEWTGTNLCVEGTKLWRLIEPPPRIGEKGGVSTVDDLLKYYRLESNAWQEEEEGSGMSLSAGWQSDYSLFHKRQHDMIPSARDLADLVDDDEEVVEENQGKQNEEYDQVLIELATNWDILQPNIPNLDTCRIHTVIQKPGDLLLIPAHWWHQTYTLEPSVAVASQRCGKSDAPLVFQHILDQVGKQPSANNVPTATSILDAANGPKDAVDRLFKALSK